MLEDYQNKVCVVTGAASGIGKALCEKLVALGAQVYALDRNKADIEGLSAFVETDLSDKGSIDAAFGVDAAAESSPDAVVVEEETSTASGSEQADVIFAAGD